MTKFLNISTDNTLGGNSPSDEVVSSQKALKKYIDDHSSGSPSFSSVTGNPYDNTNLATALNGKANDSDVVKLTGNQTIAGTKTFTDSITAKNSVSINNASSIKGTAPSSDLYTGVYFCDKNGTVFADNQLGQIQHVLKTDGTSGVYLNVLKSEANSTSGSKLGIYYPASGSAYTQAPTPTEDNTTSIQIDTVGARNTKLANFKPDGVVNQRDNTTLVKTWTGTKAQYDAIVSKDANTLYNITDDTDVTASMLELLYPVGSVYLTYNNVCPLQTLGVGTWTLESTAIITSVTGSSSVPVKGNGKSLGLTNGTKNYGLEITSTDDRCGTSSWVSCFDKTVGTSSSGTTTTSGTPYAGGVVTDASKSGIIADISSSITTTSWSINIYRRTA